MESYQIFDTDFDSNTLLSSEGIATPQKCLFSQKYLRDSSLFYAINEWRQFKQSKSTSCFEVIPRNNADNVFTAR